MNALQKNNTGFYHCKHNFTGKAHEDITSEKKKQSQKETEMQEGKVYKETLVNIQVNPIYFLYLIIISITL